MNKFIYILAFILICFSLKSQEKEEQMNILFVVDASFSMRKNWDSESKWEIAKKTILEVADSLVRDRGDNVHFGIRAYGHQSMPVKNDCNDSKLILPIAKNSIATIKDRLTRISPKGITPLAYSLEETEKDFKGLKGKNILVLITDGSESCQGDPCYIMKLLMENKVILKPFIIGLNIPIESLQNYECMASAIYNQNTQENFGSNVYQSLNNSISFSSLHINLLDEDNLPTQTDKVMLFYNKRNKRMNYSFFHKFNKKGISDTLLLDPNEYRIEVQSIPKVVSPYFVLEATKHHIVNIKVPTGVIKVSFVDENGKKVIQAKPLKYVLKKHGELNYLHQEYFDKEQGYLFGKYDIDIMTLPAKQVTIDVNKKYQEINIPAPGSVSIRSKFPFHGAIFIKNVESLINIYSLEPNSTQELLDLQPGKYEFVYRLSNERKMIKTKSVPFEVKSSKTTKIEF